MDNEPACNTRIATVSFLIGLQEEKENKITRAIRKTK
jgi:hypothetical protein